MNRPLVSIGWSTGQSDYCIKGYPKVHVFEYTMASLRNQTFKDFEVVIADTYYHKRSDYFKIHSEDFPIKHVSALPNVWLERGYPAISATKNTYLRHVRGVYVMNIGDCYYFDEQFVERTIKALEKNRYVGNKFIRQTGTTIIKKDPRPDYIDRVGGQVSMALEDYLELNGYNELFDGCKGHEDIDLGNRIRVKDGHLSVKMLEPLVIRQTHHPFPNFLNYAQMPHKCNLLAYYLSMRRIKQKIYRANEMPLTDEELDLFKNCGNDGNPANCLANTKGVCFNTKRTKRDEFDDNSMIMLNNHPSLYFDLRQSRKSWTKTL